MNNLYSEILIDHTSLHSLMKSKTESENLVPRMRELFKFIENILLSDVVWICDTVTPQTMSITEGFIEMFLKHGLAHSRADGKFRVGKFTNNQIRNACLNASKDVFEYVNKFSIKELRESVDRNVYQLRPFGAQEMNFESIAKIPFNSLESEKYIQKCLIDLGWGPSSCLPLLDSNLYTWFKEISKHSISNSDVAYSQFNTICRWKFNKELAELLSDNEQKVNYVPSYGRSKTLLSLNKYEWQQKLEQIEVASNHAIRTDDTIINIFREVSPTYDFPVPLLGMWIISKLSDKPTFEDLLEKIAEYQNSDLINQLKANLFSDSNIETNRIKEEISKELKYNQKKRNKTELSYEAVIKIPIIPKFVDLQAKATKKYATPDVKKWIREQFNHNLTTLLTGFIEDIVKVEKSNSEILNKAKSILCE